MCGNCQVIEVAPTHCVVEISKSAGDLRTYNRVRNHPVNWIWKFINLVTDFNFGPQFCESLSSLLEQKSGLTSQKQESEELCTTGKKKLDAGWW